MSEGIGNRVFEQLQKISEMKSRLDTFVAGCETGGNREGARFVRFVAVELEQIRSEIRSGTESIVQACEALSEQVDRLQKRLEEEIEAHEKTKVELEGMKKGAERLKSTAGGRGR